MCSASVGETFRHLPNVSSMKEEWIRASFEVSSLQNGLRYSPSHATIRTLDSDSRALPQSQIKLSRLCHVIWVKEITMHQGALMLASTVLAGRLVCAGRLCWSVSPELSPVQRLYMCMHGVYVRFRLLDTGCASGCALHTAYRRRS